MKKIKKISIIVTCILVVGVIITLIVKNDKIELKETLNEKKSGMFSFMLEKKDGSGYEENSATSWPSSDDYIYNPILSKCERGSKLKYDPETNKVQVTASGSDRCYIYFDTYNYEKYCKYGTEDSLVCDILRKKDNSIIYHDGYADYIGQENATLEAGDLSYRFVGTNPNNYVCLDNKEDGSCTTDDDLYRIIGFFKNNEGKYEIKLILSQGATATHLGTSGAYLGLYVGNYSSEEDKGYYKGTNLNNLTRYAWNSSLGYNSDSGNVNMWKESNLNKDNLNDFYYKYITSKITNLDSIIVKHNWDVGGVSGDNDPVKKVYEEELGKNKLTTSSNSCYDPGSQTARLCNKENDITYPAFIGLMYQSDYMYGTLPKYWTYGGNEYQRIEEIKDNDWLNVGLYESTISRLRNSYYVVRRIMGGGSSSGTFSSYYNNGARPVFYLSYSTKAKSGNGTKGTPYRLAI